MYYVVATMNIAVLLEMLLSLPKKNLHSKFRKEMHFSLQGLIPFVEANCTLHLNGGVTFQMFSVVGMFQITQIGRTTQDS